MHLFSDEVSTPTITKYPNKTYYVVGEDTSIQLTCKSDGNPQPDYYWYKENSDNPKSASENLTIKVMNKTDSGVYICDVNNTFNGGTYTRFTKMQVHVITKGKFTDARYCNLVIMYFLALKFDIMPNVQRLCLHQSSTKTVLLIRSTFGEF